MSYHISQRHVVHKHKLELYNSSGMVDPHTNDDDASYSRIKIALTNVREELYKLVKKHNAV